MLESVAGVETVSYRSNLIQEEVELIRKGVIKGLLKRSLFARSGARMGYHI